MADRATQIAAFLHATRYAAWTHTAIAGDASARRYMRLSHGDESLILMDDLPKNGASTEPFATLAAHLRTNGLSAPKVLAHDPDQGLMLMTDLGPNDFAATLRNDPTDQHALYCAATDVLIYLRGVPAPSNLAHLTPQVGAKMIEILGTHYTNAPVDDLMAEVAAALTAHAPDSNTLALRDYHAENLIWRPDRDGLDRVGLLDFQDAFVAPEGYDLASLLRDARRDVPDAVVEAAITYYMEETKAHPAFRTQLAVLGVQRNLRILGVFARLARDQGKTRYLAFMPRVWDHIMRDLADPALSRLKSAVQDSVPTPTPKVLEDLTP